MKKIFVLLTLVGVSAMFATTSLAQSSWKDSNATQPKNEIWYTSSDGTIVKPSETAIRNNGFGENVNIVSNTYQNGKGVIVFSDDVRLIGVMSFKESNLTSISIPEGVKEIHPYSFSYCTSLSSITIPKGVTIIGKCAFSNCTSLISIVIPNSVVSIEEKAFYYCTSLTSIAIPYPSDIATTTIGDKAFYNCTSLTSIYCKSSRPPRIGVDAFGGVSSNCKLYVPPTSVDVYKNTTGWKKFYTKTVGYDFPRDYYDKATNRVRGYND